VHCTLLRSTDIINDYQTNFWFTPNRISSQTWQRWWVWREHNFVTILRSTVRGLAILRAFLSRLAHERLQREKITKYYNLFWGNEAQYRTDLCTERSLNVASGAVGVGTIRASTFSHFVAVSKESGSDRERSWTTQDEVISSNYVCPNNWICGMILTT